MIRFDDARVMWRERGAAGLSSVSVTRKVTSYSPSFSGVKDVSAALTRADHGGMLNTRELLDIAGGRVWSGEDALGIGLIDTYGGLKTAIAIAVDKAGLGDSYRVTEVIEEPTGFAAFIASLNVSVREAMTRSELGLLMKEYKQVQEATKQQGVVMYYPYKLELR